MQKQKNRQNPTELEGFVNDQDLSPRNRRIRKATLLYYIQDLTQQEIANKLGVTRPTVSEYLNSDEAKQWEPYFSSKEKAELKEWLERQFWTALNESTSTFREIKNADDASYQTRLRAAKELQENQDRLVTWFQEVGLVPKPKERKEVEDNTGPSEVNFNIEWMEDEQEQEAQTE